MCVWVEDGRADAAARLLAGGTDIRQCLEALSRGDTYMYREGAVAVDSTSCTGSTGCSLAREKPSISPLGEIDRLSLL